MVYIWSLLRSQAWGSLQHNVTPFDMMLPLAIGGIGIGIVQGQWSTLEAGTQWGTGILQGRQGDSVYSQASLQEHCSKQMCAC
jgi:hypothetical protein